MYFSVFTYVYLEIWLDEIAYPIPKLSGTTVEIKVKEITEIFIPVCSDRVVLGD